MIIGISGLAGAGKDTAADMLVANHGFVKLSLADPLKRICRDVFAFTDEQLWGPSAKRNESDKRYPRQHGPIVDEQCQCCGLKSSSQNTDSQCYLTPRHALQQLGTQWGRECYKNVWIEYAVRLAKQLTETSEFHYSQQRGYYPRPSNVAKVKGVVIPDCRFKNEIVAIHEADGKVIRIKRSEAGLSGAAASHASEAEQLSIPDESFDYILDNNKTLEELSETVSLAVSSLRKE